jgi:hypothetical protein
VAQQNVPGRSTKVSEKLVLIPETVDEKEDSDEENEYGKPGPRGGEDAPLKDTEMDVLKKRGGVRRFLLFYSIPHNKETDN